MVLSTESAPTLDRYAECDEVDILVGPCPIQKREILLSTKNDRFL
jgi:hypothetical protein